MSTTSRTASKNAERYVVRLTQRALPPGLSKKDAKILRKVMRRAHYLDKGFHICGIRFGWTFLIGLIPLAGDITDALLNYHLVVKKAKQVDGYVALLTQYSRVAHPPNDDEQRGLDWCRCCAAGG